MNVRAAFICFVATLAGLVALSPRKAEAVACFSSNDSLALTPTAVTYDTLIVPRAIRSSLFEIDGGPAFDVNTSFVTASGNAGLSLNCMDVAKAAVVTTADPWAGVDGGNLFFQVVLQ